MLILGSLSKLFQSISVEDEESPETKRVLLKDVSLPCVLKEYKRCITPTISIHYLRISNEDYLYNVSCNVCNSSTSTVPTEKHYQKSNSLFLD